MKRLLAATGVFLLAPTLALAAGFSSQSIFLSQNNVTEGDTVQIHATISNDSVAKFTGDLLFTDQDTTVGSVPVTLGPGAADTVSVPWKPVAGVHIITANLRDTAKNSVGKQTATFTIAAKPSPTKTAAVQSQPPVVVDSSAPIQSFIAGLSPTVAKTSTPFFSTVDAGRASLSKTLTSGVAWAKKQIAESTINGPGISGAGGDKPATTTILGTAFNTGKFIFATFCLYLFSIVQYIVANAGVFYPAAAFLFFYILWRLYKRMRRPRY